MLLHSQARLLSVRGVHEGLQGILKAGEVIGIHPQRSHARLHHHTMRFESLTELASKHVLNYYRTL